MKVLNFLGVKPSKAEVNLFIWVRFSIMTVNRKSMMTLMAMSAKKNSKQCTRDASQTKLVLNQENCLTSFNS